MKLTKILLTAVAGTMTLLTSHALASSPGAIKITGKTVTQSDTTTKKTIQSTTITTTSISDAFLFNVISNVVVNVGTNGTGLVSTNFPAGGYIAFDPTGNDGQAGGTFYVTNKSGFYYPLSGLDTNDNYYSFIELDAYNSDPDNQFGQVDFGFSGNFNGVESGDYNTTTGDGTLSVQSSAVLYVHDNPYSFNDGDNANAFYANNNSLEIRGIADIKITYKGSNVEKWSVSLTGSGNAIINGSQNSLVVDGHFTSNN